MDALCNHHGMTPPCNTKGLADENGAIEGPHGHLKRAIADALIMRGSHDFEDPEAYRRFIDEVVGRTGARIAKRIDVERAGLKPLPARRTTDYEEVTVRVTSPGGFLLRKVFYTVPSRLTGHQLRVRIYDDRPDLFLGVSLLVTLPRPRNPPRPASACGELPPCHPFAAQKAVSPEANLRFDGADGTGLP
jgi:hypothetical protein